MKTNKLIYKGFLIILSRSKQHGVWGFIGYLNNWYPVNNKPLYCTIKPTWKQTKKAVKTMIKKLVAKGITSFPNNTMKLTEL